VWLVPGVRPFWGALEDDSLLPPRPRRLLGRARFDVDVQSASGDDVAEVACSDHHRGVPRLSTQAMEHADQLLHVRHVQADR